MRIHRSIGMPKYGNQMIHIHVNTFTPVSKAPLSRLMLGTTHMSTVNGYTGGFILDSLHYRHTLYKTWNNMLVNEHTLGTTCIEKYAR